MFYSHIVIRKRLENLIEGQAQTSTFFLIAAPGSGKSITVQTILDRQNEPVIWCKLEFLKSNDLAIFTNYFIDSCCQNLHGFDRKILQQAKWLLQLNRLHSD